MDDIEFRDALRRYTESGGPPFPLTSDALISQGRRRARWRMGLGVSSAGVVSLAMASVIVLPAGGGSPTLEQRGCEWSLPIHLRPTQSPPVTMWPSGQPTVHPTGEPSGTPTASNSPGEPSAHPSGRPSGSPTASNSPGEATPTPVPSLTVTRYPASPTPVDTAAPTPTPVVTPSATELPADVGPDRLDAMSCHLKGEMLKLFPEAGFAPPSEGPMELVIETSWWPSGGWQVGYTGRALVVVDGQPERWLSVSVRQRPAGWRPDPEAESRAVFKGRTAYIYRWSADSFELTLATDDSLVTVMALDGLMTIDQAGELASAPELDLYR